MSHSQRMGLLIGGIVLGIILIFTVWGIGVNNSAISQEENIKEARSAITNAEAIRGQKISALVNGIRTYTGEEQATIQAILDTIESAMSDGDYDEVNTKVNALFQIPQMQSVSLYMQFANEYAIEANKVRNYYEDHNGKVARYNTHFRKFPNKMFLSMGGAEKVDFELYELPTLVVVDMFNPFG